MNNQSSLVRILLLAGAGVLVLFLAYQFFLAPLLAYNEDIGVLQGQLGDKEAELFKTRRLQQQLQRWRQQSLPANRDQASVEYDQYLAALMRETHLKGPSLAHADTSGQHEARLATSKKLFYVPLDFTADFQANLGSLVNFLHRVQTTPLVHKVKSLKIELGEKGKKDDLKVKMQLEALVLDGADRAQPNLTGLEGHFVELDVLNTLTRGPALLSIVSQAAPGRNYAQLSRLNIFTGLQPGGPTSVINVSRYVYLTTILGQGNAYEAVLLDRWNNNKVMTLRKTTGSNRLSVHDDHGDELFKGEVAQIGPRDVYLKVGERYFDLHVGENLGQALRSPVPAWRLPALGLAEPEEPDDF